MSKNGTTITEPNPKGSFAHARALLSAVGVGPFREKSVVLILILQVALAILYAWAYNEIQVSAGSIMTAIVDQDRQGFARTSAWIATAGFIGGIANSAILSMGEYLTMNIIRGHWTRSLSALYIEKQAYFTVVHLERSVTDPDRRIASDLCTLCAKLKLILFGTPMYVGYVGTTATFVYFFVSLVRQAGWFVPIVALISFIITTAISSLLSTFPTRASSAVTQANSAFQFAHTYFALHSEHIAFLRGEKEELAVMDAHLSAAARHTTRFAWWSFPMNTMTIVFFWGNGLLSYLVPGLAWVLLHESTFTDYATLASVSSVLYSFLGNLTVFILLSQEWSELRSALGRVAELVEVLQRAHRRVDEELELQLNDEPRVDIIGVTVRRPTTTEVLVRDLTVSVTANHSVVLMGPSGCGKSSLLRVVAGLWPGSGIIRRPKSMGSGGVLFLPQRPYLPIATLAAQVTYPHSPPSAPCGRTQVSESPDVSKRLAGSSGDLQSLGNSQVESLLDEVGLGYLVERFSLYDDIRNWSQILSIGEQQRVAMARALYHLPSVCILDEATSAMDEDNEERVLTSLKRRQIALLSVAHRSTVRRFHDSVLRIALGGSWSMEGV